MDAMLERLGTSRLSQPVKAQTVLMRPEVHLSDIIDADEKLKSQVKEITSNTYVLEQIEIQIKYSGYIQKEYEMVEELSNKENSPIPEKLITLN